MIKGKAIALTNGWLDLVHAKTCHGLLRGSDRFEISAVVDPKFAGQDIVDVTGIKEAANVPMYGTVRESLNALEQVPDYCIVGVAIHGGKLPEKMRGELFEAIRAGMSIVCGLHTFLSEDVEFVQLAKEHNVQLIDVRKPPPHGDLHFWTGEIYSVNAPRIAVIGMDCAIGKRTTSRIVMDACRDHQIKAEMIYTGQTGWMEGYPYGFIFDSLVNDFISGEVEHAIVQCDNDLKPDVIFLEGQSALRNPSGPCGSEFLISGAARGAILQHVPGRPYFDGAEYPAGKLPSVESEIELIRIFGSETLGITLNAEGMSADEINRYQKELEGKLGIPVVQPLAEGVGRLIPVIRSFLDTHPEPLPRKSGGYSDHPDY
ncbi:MAG: DUF1611 domain-containing protein [Calditrichia bacterium]